MVGNEIKRSADIRDFNELLASFPSALFVDNLVERYCLADIRMPSIWKNDL